MLRVSIMLAVALSLAARGEAASTATTAPAVTPATSSSTIASLGDSITLGEGARTTYTTVMARDLHLTPINLGITGQSVETAINDQAPRLPRNCAVVTILLGTNDVYPITHQTTSPQDFIGSLQALLSQIRTTCPAARILVGTGILDHRPPYFNAGIDVVNDAIRALKGVIVVDLHADPRLHDARNYNDDLTHPNDAGHAIIAADFEAALAQATQPAYPTSDPPILYSTPLQPVPSWKLMEDGYVGRFHVRDACTGPGGVVVAHLGASDLVGPIASVTLDADRPGRCTIHVADEASREVAIPIAVYGPLIVDRARLQMRLGDAGTNLRIAEDGYFNGFGITFPCTSSAGTEIVHWTKPTLAGPSTVETIVPDRIGACSIHVYDFNTPAQTLDVPVTVTQ